MTSCFFIGHREAGAELQSVLNEAVERYVVEYNVTEFIVGSYGQFDIMAANAVIRAKKQYPAIVLLRLTPYHPAERPMLLPAGFDGTLYPFEDPLPPRRLAIAKANEAMLKGCDFLIAYAWHPGSNARNIVEKAKRMEKQGGIRVENLAEY